jgi:hypothetical protein
LNPILFLVRNIEYADGLHVIFEFILSAYQSILCSDLFAAIIKFVDVVNLPMKGMKLFLREAVTEAYFYRYCPVVMDPGRATQALWYKRQLDVGT